MNIPFNNFKAEPQNLQNQEVSAAERVIRSGHYILGPEVSDFEQRWASYSGSKFSVGVGNGMDALEIGMRALGIGPGDEIITTPLTALATVFAIMRTGASPVLADIEVNTGLLSISSVERCLSKKTKAVLLVHLYGQVRNLQVWKDFCMDRQIELLEDCAQSHGARWDGVGCGNFGRWGAFSFYPTKNLGAIGDGGALNTSDPEIFHHAKSLRNYGQSDRYRHPIFGFNSRLDEIQAAILSERLIFLNDFIEKRRQVAAEYQARIKNPLIRILDEPLSAENHVYHLFVVRTPKRDSLQKYLKESGVETIAHYPIPAHLQIPLRACRSDPLGLMNAELFSDECLSLPCNPQISKDEARYIADLINRY